MKRTFIITLLVTLVSMSGWSQSSYFEKFKNMDHVDYVKLQGKQLTKKNKLNGNVIDVRDVADKLNYVISISMQKPVFVKGCPKSKDDCMTTEVIEAHESLEYIKKEYVQMLRGQDKDEIVGIYYKDKGNDVYEYVIYDEEDEELNIIVLSSVMEPDALVKFLNK